MWLMYYHLQIMNTEKLNYLINPFIMPLNGRESYLLWKLSRLFFAKPWGINITDLVSRVKCSQHWVEMSWELIAIGTTLPQTAVPDLCLKWTLFVSNSCDNSYGCIPNANRSSFICSAVRFFFMAPEGRADRTTANMRKKHARSGSFSVTLWQNSIKTRSFVKAVLHRTTSTSMLFYKGLCAETYCTCFYTDYKRFRCQR